MASKYVCRCGETVRTNLYEGHGLHLLVPEAATDLTDEEQQKPLADYVSTLVLSARVVATCRKCGCIALVDNAYNVKLYAPVE